jgi:hypothetical protein
MLEKEKTKRVDPKWAPDVQTQEAITSHVATYRDDTQNYTSLMQTSS